MSDEKKKKVYLLLIFVFTAIIIVSVVTLIRLSKPKIDYDAMAKELLQYVYTFDKVKDIEVPSDDIYNITIESDSWYAASERDKLLLCKKLNEGITVICQKYKIIKDTQIAYVYYYDEDGIKIAEPGKGFTLESIILH